MKKALLFLLFTISFSGLAQVEKSKKDEPQKGDLIINTYEGDLDMGDETDPPLNYATLPVKPEYPGGIAALYEYINKNINLENLTSEAKNKELEGTISFIVERDGTMSNIKVIKNPGFGFDNEILRILDKLKTKWSPGKKADGTIVRSNFILPIRFTVPE